MKKIYYYSSLDDDLVKSKNQDYKLKSNYKWIHNNLFYKIVSFFVYIFVILFSFIYCKLFLHIKIKNKKILKKEKGYFLYCNHTQMLGDVFNPFLICSKSSCARYSVEISVVLKNVGFSFSSNLYMVI